MNEIIKKAMLQEIGRGIAEKMLFQNFQKTQIPAVIEDTLKIEKEILQAIEILEEAERKESREAWAAHEAKKPALDKPVPQAKRLDDGLPWQDVVINVPQEA